VLRRLKVEGKGEECFLTPPFPFQSDVLKELPEKIVQDRLCELTQLQREMYKMVVDRCTVLGGKKAQNESGKEDGEGGSSSSGTFTLSP
jgi:SNF2 family DNA or RNA helicase